MLKDLIELL